MISRSVHIERLPRGNYMVSPLLSLEVATPENNFINSKLLSICKKVRTGCGSPPYKQFLAGCSSPFTGLADYLTALRAWYTQ